MASNNSPIKLVKFGMHALYSLLFIFSGTFMACFVGNVVSEIINKMSFHIAWRLIAKNSAVYGLCTLFAVIVVLPAMFCIKRYIWPALKLIGLKIRYFFHGY